ncbi:MAG: hypothetical protein KC502_23225 [Myxococcales bacterium]|nr:hypothetical protein [Myxococcales bacterium]
MTFYIQRDGQPKQYSIEALSDMVKSGQLRADEYVFDGRTQKWVGATQVAELAGAWKATQGGKAASTPKMSAAPANKPKKRSSKKFSETSWFMSAVTYEEGGLTPSEMPEMDVGDKFENLPPVPDELRKKFSLSTADLDSKKK